MSAWAEAAPPTGPASGDPLRLPETMLPTMQPLINSALSASAKVLQSRLALLMAQAGEKDAKSGLYPHTSGGAEFDGRQEYREDIPGVHYSGSMAYSLTTVQPLYHWDALTNRARMGEIQRELATNDLAEARRELVLMLRQQYTDLILRAQDLAKARWDDDRLTRQLQRDTESAARGEVPTFDLADERLALEQNHLAIERQSLDWDKAREDFAVLIGAKEPAYPADNLPTDIPPVPDWSARLRPADPATTIGAGAPVPAALVQAEKNREVARLNLEIERVRLRPTLDLVAGITENLVAYTANTAQTYGADIRYVGLRISWNIFDGYQSEAAVSRATADLREKNLDYDLAAQALQRQMTDGWRDLELGQRELAVREARYVQTTSRLEADQSRKDAGQIADKDWDQRLLDQKLQHLDLMRARAAQLLRISEYALVQVRGTQPTEGLNFP